MLLVSIFAFNAYMNDKSIPQPTAVVTYPAIVGQVIAHQRSARGIKQGDLATALGLSQSAYSRLESGDSVLNLSQLNHIAARLVLSPARILELADQYQMRLLQQGVNVVPGKQDHSAAIAIGLGLLAALFISS